MDLSALPQLVELVNKGGVVGLLILVCAVLVWEVIRLRKQSVTTFKERDAYRLRYALCKAALDQAKLSIDLSALDPIPGLE